MKLKLLLASLIAVLLSSCGQNNSTQIAENTFVYKHKVYRLVDNELTEVADLVIAGLSDGATSGTLMKVLVDNAKKLLDLGADLLVVGSGIFGADDVVSRIKEFKN